MKFTDLFIHRPVLASVISLLILLLGLRAIQSLEVREYPEMKNTVVTVSTFYPGADSELVKGFVTTPLQQAISEANGIDYISSTSTRGSSVIEAHMKLDYDPNDAVSEIQAKVASQRNVLPAEVEDPVIESSTGQRTALMYIAFYGGDMSLAQITDYLLRVVQPKLQAIPGVAKARLAVDKIFAMRIWLDPRRMAALGVTATDVRDVLRRNNYLSGVGQVKGDYVAMDLTATTDVSKEKDFRNLVVRAEDGTLVRISDIADTELGSESYDTTTWYNGNPAIFIAIEPAPGANPLTVAKSVHVALPDIGSQLPAGLKVFIPYDASVFIQDSIREVFRTLAEAVLIVLVIIYLSLGSLRAALIPAVAVPLSLIGAAFIMLLMGFSINLLTLLALVLAIGLVVDDAIVVVENIHRHLELGESRFQAAIKGARELGLPIIAMTTTLVAVYAPIGFMEGLVGTLFTEFAFALAGAVLISGIVALTLSPMLSSKVLHSSRQSGRFERGVEWFFNGLAHRYQRLLHNTLDYKPVTIVFGLLILASIYPMVMFSQNELAPAEDQSVLLFQARAPQTATVEYSTAYMHQVAEIFKTIPEYQQSFILIGQGGNPSNIFGGLKMPPPSQRERGQAQIRVEMQKKLAGVAGLQIGVFSRPSLPGSGGGVPIQFVITSDSDYAQLDKVADDLLGKALASGKFIFLQKSLEYTRPQARINIDRDLAADLGISMEDIGQNLATALGGNYVNRFSLQGRSYKVIPQVTREFRANYRMLDDYYVRARSGELVPLSTLVSFDETVEPSVRSQFQQLNSLTLDGVMAPGVSQGEALEYLQNQARQSFPRGFTWDYTGSSRQYIQEGHALAVAIILSLLVIYLVLAAQFESWRDPFIILMSVPMSIAGALIFITLGFASINIYTQVGLMTLIGLIAKNGILIVEFANQLQIREKLSRRAAVEKAAGIRLRPILMTTVAMIMAMVPLLSATGPGAASRFNMGLVIAAGLGIGTLFTLFVVPAVYTLLARDHQAAEAMTRDLEQGQASPHAGV